jgi:hypothetical protein
MILSLLEKIEELKNCSNLANKNEDDLKMKMKFYKGSMMLSWF